MTFTDDDEIMQARRELEAFPGDAELPALPRAELVRLCGAMHRAAAALGDATRHHLMAGRGYRLTMLQMTRDAIAWQQQIGGSEADEQIELYRAAAAELGITALAIGGPGNVRRNAPRDR